MRASDANTFTVGYYYDTGTGFSAHVLIGVKAPDGSISYIDFQHTPPKVFDSLDPHCYGVSVIPTNVDWRFNRQIYAAYENAPHEPMATTDWNQSGPTP
jgi:hypothetical protein